MKTYVFESHLLLKGNYLAFKIKFFIQMCISNVDCYKTKYLKYKKSYNIAANCK